MAAHHALRRTLTVGLGAAGTQRTESPAELVMRPFRKLCGLKGLLSSLAAMAATQGHAPSPEERTTRRATGRPANRSGGPLALRRRSCLR